MWSESKPIGKGHEHINGGYCDRWSCKHGSGESYNGELINGDYKINDKITVFIIGSALWIVDNRYSGKSDVWEYSSEPHSIGMTNIAQERIHALEPDKIETILNKDFDCELWKMIQKRAKEIYAGV